MADDVTIEGSLQREWLLCAVVAAGARFVPVPLLDDVVKEQANRTAVARALKARGRTYPVPWVSPLYSTGSLWATLVGLPLKVILYPVRKIVKVVGAVHGVPTDLIETLLLGRAVVRLLERGALAGDDEQALREEARTVRQAFDEAFSGMNFKVLSSALGDAFGHLKDLGDVAASFARELLERKDEAGPAATDEAGQAALAEELHEVEEALQRSDVQEVLALFDQRFDAAWEKRAA